MAATTSKEQGAVPADLDGVRTPEPLEDFPKREDQEGSSPETSLPYKWVVEAANLLIPAVGSSLSEALDLIESVMLVTALDSGPRAPANQDCFSRGRASFCSLRHPGTSPERMLSAQLGARAWGPRWLPRSPCPPALQCRWGGRAPQRRWHCPETSGMTRGGRLRPVTVHGRGWCWRHRM